MTHRFTFGAAPQRIYWETTSACDLACRHCRAEATPTRDPEELTTEEGFALLRSLARFGEPLPHLVLTGGDPLKRDDLWDFIRAARELGFGVSVAPSATPLLTPAAIARLREAGVDAISLSLDGATADHHDRIRGIEGTFERTREAAAAARAAGLPFQVNTLVCAETVDDLPEIHEEVIRMGAARWSLFFLITVGRGQVLSPISPERAEQVLSWVAQLSQARGRPGAGRGPILTTTEAPHLRRVVVEAKKNASHDSGSPGGGHPGAPQGHAHHGAGIRDGNGILFISATGEICPSGFLELPAGHVRADDVVSVYRDAPLFQALRDPDHFGGRCGRCEYRFACGGSRARAYSASGDPLAEDPLCPHEPAAAPSAVV